MARTLPTIALEDLRIASPCTASWDAMQGDDRVRFCGSCRKNVFNLSNMSREDAVALVEKTEQVGGKMCVRLYRRKDGTVLTQDCPVGLAAVRRRLAWIGAAVAAGLGVVAAVIGLRERGAAPSDPPPIGGGGAHVMGDYAPPVEMGRMAAPPQQVVTPPPPEVEVEMGAPVWIPPEGQPPVDATPVDGGEVVEIELQPGGVAPVDSGD